VRWVKARRKVTANVGWLERDGSLLQLANQDLALGLKRWEDVFQKALL